MNKIEENKNCYASQIQREILLNLIANSTIEKFFFLTGGTALSVFYLHHRVSNDLDFFTLETTEISEIDFWIKTMWPQESVKIKESPNFLSVLIKEIKVDFVIDLLSNREERIKVLLENGHYLLVDNIKNISSNKFCTIASRIEPKDFVDFYFIQKTFPSMSIENIYNDAKKKDAIFDDPPTVAFQIEEGFNFLKENPNIIPQMKIHLDMGDFFNFYKILIEWIYEQVKL